MSSNILRHYQLYIKTLLNHSLKIALWKSRNMSMLWFFKYILTISYKIKVLLDCNNFPRPCGAAAQHGPWPPHSWGFTHNDASQSAGLLWTSDQCVAETSTWQHTTLTIEEGTEVEYLFDRRVLRWVFVSEEGAEVRTCLRGGWWGEYLFERKVLGWVFVRKWK